MSAIHMGMTSSRPKSVGMSHLVHQVFLRTMGVSKSNCMAPYLICIFFSPPGARPS
jgi:hypothetical protein